MEFTTDNIVVARSIASYKRIINEFDFSHFLLYYFKKLIS